MGGTLSRGAIREGFVYFGELPSGAETLTLRVPVKAMPSGTTLTTLEIPFALEG